MGDYWSLILIGGALFAAVFVLLTAEPKVAKRLTAIAGGTALAIGLLAYGYGYMAVRGNFMEATLRTLYSVCRMFLGDPDFGDIGDAPLFAHQWIVTLCWLAHILAVYSTSSAVVSLFGANVLKTLRVRFAKRKDLNIIFGLNEGSAAFGQELSQDPSELVIYVSEDTESSLAGAILESGALLRADPKALRGDAQFLRSIGAGKGSRKITLYALQPDGLENTEYASTLLDSFRIRGIPAERLNLVIHARDDRTVRQLQVSKDRFGYGFITVFQEQDLAARLLMQKYPPCDQLSFDAEGKAEQDFEAVVIGFGQLGQTVLRSIIMHSQFIGNSFRADVFDPDLQAVDGHFQSVYPGIRDNYHVEFHAADGRSRALYAHLQERLEKIRYLVICTGSEPLDAEIEAQLRDFFQRKGQDVSIHRCSRLGIKTTDIRTDETVAHRIYHPDVLATKTLDRMAMTVNRYYMGSYSKGALADWMDCDYFSRMSNRAFADSIPAVLRAAGKTEEQVLSGQWDFTPAQLENLGQMEHARWNAFHFCMGFLPMSEEEYAARTAIYLEQKAATGKGSIRIGKNLDRKTHACLISWDALDELSDRENRITSGQVDYKQMDKNNILLLPELFRIRDRETDASCS